MKTLFLLLFLCFSLSGFSQEMSLIYENANNRLRLTIVNSKRFDLDYTYKPFVAGVVDWEQGNVVVRKKKMILISDTPENPTSLKKMVLKKSKATYGESCYFLADETDLWRVSRVKNKAFEKRLFTTERSELLNNQAFPE